MTYAQAYETGKNILTKAGISEAGLEARLLLEHVCGTGRNDLLVHGDRPVDSVQCSSYEQLLARRAERLPLQYLTESQEFMGLDFAVNGHVLIPRQDTEILVEEVLRNLHDGMEILDMCTGSGCILISLLRYSNDCAGLGVDISGDALRVARKNAENILNGFPVKVQFLESNLFESVEGMFDVIVSNPPYIPAGDIEGLMPEVRDYEPRIALDGGEDGLDFYRKILEGSRCHLKKGGMLFFEIGYDQGEAVSKMMKDAGFLEVLVRKDYAGLDRVVFGTRSFA
ncbi:MAG: peptide chain release factor N(5)-glutamine methyltransferase [Acetatifactor sp.]|nr:peptide chain release factor N(5)-glutamine methyltransferase [Acetatifactor sp.]MDE7351923.1 peptide chain release factor N(5)-glutamine methyltransferase [Acetatifactor sp.]